MNKEQNYHIDVSADEAKLFTEPLPEKKPLFEMPKLPKISMRFPTIFCAVLGAHIILAVALFGTTVKETTNQEDKKALSEPIPTPIPAPSASPTPNVVIQEPVPKIVEKPVQKPTPKPLTKPAPSASIKHSKYTESYVVKQGDTFDKIVKKFKLNKEKLQKLNNVKDTNKIVVGQTLKFL